MSVESEKRGDEAGGDQKGTSRSDPIFAISMRAPSSDPFTRSHDPNSRTSMTYLCEFAVVQRTKSTLRSENAKREREREMARAEGKAIHGFGTVVTEKARPFDLLRKLELKAS